MSDPRWRSLMEALGFPPCLDMYEKLCRFYGERHRAYHTMEHIDACLRHLEAVWDDAEQPAQLELAIWFHDAIYKPFSVSNEADSAKLASEFMTTNQAGEATIEGVHELIMATIHDATPKPGDASLMVDIDLSILGAPAEVYADFERAVRKEYKRVPSFVFRRNRRKLLLQFLDRERIYQHPYFFDRLEALARSNLSSAVQALS
jgi:predicted metal-dependent HD superfamily phosphohydrolase